MLTSIASLFVPAAMTVLVGSTGNDGDFPLTLVSIDRERGTIESLGDNIAFYSGLDEDPGSGRLFGGSNQLTDIDPETGAGTVIGPFLEADLGGTGILMTGMTVSPEGRIVVLSSPTSDPDGVRTLYEVDPVTGGLTEIGSPGVLIFAIEFDDNGILYGGFASLYELDPATGAVISDLGAIGANVIELEARDDGYLDSIQQLLVVDTDPQTLYEQAAAGLSTAATDSVIHVVDPKAPAGEKVVSSQMISNVQLWSLADIASTCRDLTGDGTVTLADIVVVLASWGDCAECPADLTGDGTVDVSDLMAILDGWGPCS